MILSSLINNKIFPRTVNITVILCCNFIFSAGPASGQETLHVAAVQMRSSDDLFHNAERIRDFVREVADKGARVAVFPECALSGYSGEYIKSLSEAEIAEAEKLVREACRHTRIYAIFGMPYREGSKLYNSATVVSPEGRIIERYHKIQLAEKWSDPGDHLSVFRVDGTSCSIIICHDERYPELVRLPVLAGSRIVFYISFESGLKEEQKINPYRAQIQARAAENNIFIVHANGPANPDATGSHGQSRIIGPDGNIIIEASIFGEEILDCCLDLESATGNFAGRSIRRGILQDWWKEGLKRVVIIENE